MNISEKRRRHDEIMLSVFGDSARIPTVGMGGQLRNIVLKCRKSTVVWIGCCRGEEKGGSALVRGNVNLTEPQTQQ